MTVSQDGEFWWYDVGCKIIEMLYGGMNLNNVDSKTPNEALMCSD